MYTTQLYISAVVHGLSEAMIQYDSMTRGQFHLFSPLLEQAGWGFEHGTADDLNCNTEGVSKHWQGLMQYGAMQCFVSATVLCLDSTPGEPITLT